MNLSPRTLISEAQTLPLNLSGVIARVVAERGTGSGIPYRVQFADGTAHRNGEAPPCFTVVLRTPAAARRLAIDRPTWKSWESGIREGQT